MNLYPYIKTRALRVWFIAFKRESKAKFYYYKKQFIIWAINHRKQIKDWVLFIVLIILLAYVFNTDYQSCLGGGYTC